MGFLSARHLDCNGEVVEADLFCLLNDLELMVLSDGLGMREETRRFESR